MAKTKKKPGGNTIALNKKAKFDFELHERVEAGVALLGWEVKSLRQGKVQLTDSYVIFKKGEAWLLGYNITPLPSASTHFVTDSTRTRNLLIMRKYIYRHMTYSEIQCYTMIAMAITHK